MKKYRLKIPFFYGRLFNKGSVINEKTGWYSTDGEFGTIDYKIVENNPDIFELIKEPEPQEEVIEGTAYTCCEKHIGFYFENMRKAEQKNIPARLILNPKPRKEYVGYLSKKGLSEMQRGETPMYISMNKDKNYYIEITITVEDSE